MNTDVRLEHTLTIEQILGLRRPEDHPSAREAVEAIKAGERAVKRADADVDAARAEQRAAEQSAALGRRDDKRLQAAGAKVQQTEQERRIALAKLEADRASAATTITSAALQVEATLQRAHMAKLAEEEQALEVVNRINAEVAQLEEASQRLFPGIDRQRRGLAGRPLVRLSWREFSKDGRFALWKEVWRRMASYTPSLPQGEPLVSVRFVKSADTAPALIGGSYNAGEIAGFTPSKAEQLIAQGIAERV